MSDGMWGLIGVVVGAILGFGGTMLTNLQAGWAERKKVRNRVIYFLLEIHHLLSKLKGPMPDIASFYSEYLLNRFGPEAAAAVRNDDVEQIQIRMEGILKNSVMKDLLALQAKYPDALTALSEIDPISCYRLSALATNLHQAEEFIEDTGVGLKDVLENADMEDAKSFWGKLLTPSIVLINLETIQGTLEDMSSGPFNSKLAKEITEITSIERQDEVVEEFRLKLHESLDIHFEKHLAGNSKDNVGEEE